MITTLIKTLTASNSASLEFADGTSDVVFDNTYDEYMFVFTDINPATDTANFTFMVNASGETGYNDVVMTTTFFSAYHNEDNSGSPDVGYFTGQDQAQGGAYQQIMYYLGNGSDESGAGIMHFFSPASTTYVKNFYARTQVLNADNRCDDVYTAGYINDTNAIDEISFKMSSGNFDGVIQLYGIA